MTPQQFVEKWSSTQLRERQGAHSHFIDLCRLLGVETPTDADPTGEWYAFEKGASKTGGGEGWADVWKRNCFAWEYKSPGKDLAQALRLAEEGADILDIGGESTRPGSDTVALNEELRRVLPVIEGLRAKTDKLISIDTRKAEVMRRAADAGADILNDVSALTHDPAALATAAETGLPAASPPRHARARSARPARLNTAPPRSSPARARNRRRDGTAGDADARAGRSENHERQPAIRRRGARRVRLPRAAHPCLRGGRHPSRAHRRRSGHRLRQASASQRRGAGLDEPLSRPRCAGAAGGVEEEADRPALQCR